MPAAFRLLDFKEQAEMMAAYFADKMIETFNGEMAEANAKEKAKDMPKKPKNTKPRDLRN